MLRLHLLFTSAADLTIKFISTKLIAFSSQIQISLENIKKTLHSKWPQFNFLSIFNPLREQKKNINEFLRQLASCIQIAGIANNDRHQYLHLHLKGGALTFFDQLPEATRVFYDLAVAALRERYQNDQSVQLQKLISARTLKSFEESAQDFLTDLQRLALEAYPNVVARAAAGVRPAVAAEDRALERARRVREAFINGMPFKLKKFPMTRQSRITVQKQPVE